MKKLSILFLLTLLPLMVGAEYFVVNIDDIYYELNTETKEAKVINGYNTLYSGRVIIPSSVIYDKTAYSITSIWGAFSGCSELTSVSIPNSVKEIGNNAFDDCSLTSITIPNSVTSIGQDAFYRCSGLKSIDIPNSVISIGSRAFDGSAWYENQPDGVVYAGKVVYKYKGEMSENTSISIKEGTLGIASCAFDGCSNLTSASIPNSVTTIGLAAFSGCSGLTSVTIPNSVTTIGLAAFSNCSNLKSVTIPNSVVTIGEQAFSDCSGLNSITIPNTVVEIGNGALSGCSGELIVNRDIPAGSEWGSGPLGGNFSSVKIGEGVHTIGEYAFQDNTHTNLKSVTFPSTITEIGKRAFFFYSRLDDVYCYAEDVPKTGTEVFNPVYDYDQIASATLHVPQTSMELYKRTEPWCHFGKIVALTLRGDANGDGEIGMPDVMFVVNYILGTPDASFNKEAADANLDGEVGMPDVMFIVNYILNGEFPKE